MSRRRPRSPRPGGRWAPDRVGLVVVMVLGLVNAAVTATLPAWRGTAAGLMSLVVALGLMVAVIALSRNGRRRPRNRDR